MGTKNRRNQKQSGVIKQLFPKYHICTEDQFLKTINATALPPDTVKSIIRLHSQGKSRSEIARQLKIEKMHVIKILMEVSRNVHP